MINNGKERDKGCKKEETGVPSEDLALSSCLFPCSDILDRLYSFNPRWLLGGCNVLYVCVSILDSIVNKHTESEVNVNL